jgi:hypothetical protein
MVHLDQAVAVAVVALGQMAEARMLAAVVAVLESWVKDPMVLAELVLHAEFVVLEAEEVALVHLVLLAKMILLALVEELMAAAEVEGLETVEPLNLQQLRLVQLAPCVLSGPAQLVHSHQQIQVICDETLHRN